MADRADTLSIYVSANTKPLEKNFKKAEKEVKGFTGTVNKLGKALKSNLGFLAAGAGAAIMARKISDLAVESVKLASDFDEAESKARVLFGPQAQLLISDYGKTAATSLGMSANAALEAATNYGQLLRSFGASEAEAADLSANLVKLSADLNSFSNRSDAAQAIFSGLSGEMEPLKKFGVTLLDSRVKAEALAMGLEMVGGQLSPLNKALASYSLIMKDTAVAQGDFERTQDGLANTTRTLNASLEDAKRVLGEGFLFGINEVNQALGGPGGTADVIKETGESLSSIAYGFGVATAESVKFFKKLAEESGGLGRRLEFLISKAYEFSNLGLLEKLGEAQKEQARNAEAAAEAQRLLEAAYNASARAASNYETQVRQLSAAQAASAALLDLSRKEIQQQDAAGRAKWRQFDEDLARRRKQAEALAESLSGGGGGGGSSSSTVPIEDLEKYQQLLESFTSRYRNLTDQRIAALQKEVNLWSDLESEVNGAFSTTLSTAINDYTQHLAALESFDEAIARAIADGDNEAAVTAAAEKAALGAADDYVTAWAAALEYNSAVKAKIGAAMASLIADNPQLKDGARLLTSELLALDPAVADTAITKLVNEGTLDKIAGQLQAAAQTDNQISQQFADLFYAAGITAATDLVNAIDEELQTDKERNKLIKAGKAAGQTFGDAFIKEIRAAISQATREAGAARASSSRALMSANPTALTATPAAGPVVINVHAAVADPISVGRTVQSVLEKRKLRLGI